MKKTLLFILFCKTIGLQAQNNTVSCGGQAIGSGGSVSYTTGQIDYSFFTGNYGSINQGVQQNYDISIITSLTDVSINLKVQIYPNPTKDQLNLSVFAPEFKNLKYALTDVNGRNLKREDIDNTTTIINVSKCSSGIYFLHILSNNKKIKTFQFVKIK